MRLKWGSNDLDFDLQNLASPLLSSSEHLCKVFGKSLNTILRYQAHKNGHVLTKHYANFSCTPDERQSKTERVLPWLLLAWRLLSGFSPEVSCHWKNHTGNFRTMLSSLAFFPSNNNDISWSSYQVTKVYQKHRLTHTWLFGRCIITFCTCSVVIAEIRTREIELAACWVTQKDKSTLWRSIPNLLVKVGAQTHP